MPPIGFDDNVFKSLYTGWNDRGAAEQDFKANGANKYWSHLKQGGQMLGDPTNSQNLSLYQKAQGERTTERQKSEMDARFAGDKAELTDFNTRFSSAVPQAIENASNKYDVKGKLDLTTGLRSRIDDLKNNISGYGAGGYASGQQVDRAIGLKYIPQYNTAAQNLQDASSLALDEANFAIKPFEVEGQLLNDRLARQSTGYDNAQQRELDSLLTTMRLGQEMSIADKDRLQRLAEAEMSYEIEKEKLAKAETEIITVGGRKKLINKQTGAVISDLGSSSEGGGSGTGNIGSYLNTSNTTTPQPTGGNSALESIWQGMSWYQDQTPDKVKQQIISGNLSGTNLNGLNLGKQIGY